MIEVKGNLWDDFYQQPSNVICITTNGSVKKNGDAVMGRGCAFEATQRIPGLAAYLGRHLQKNGNVPCWLHTGLISFPVKHAWYEDADLELIAQSTEWLHREALNLGQKVFGLPRPGCGNGKLSYSQVRPLLVNLPDNVMVIDFA